MVTNFPANMNAKDCVYRQRERCLIKQRLLSTWVERVKVAAV